MRKITMGDLYALPQSISFSGDCQISNPLKKRVGSKIHSGVLGSFWKRQKSIQGEILPGSYTAIFFSTFIFHRKKLMFKPCRSKKLDFH